MCYDAVSKMKSMQKQILCFYSAIALAATFALFGCASTGPSVSATSQQFSTAVEGWRTAAEKGEVSAQFRLGWAYEHGEGVSTDKREAVRWYRKAAEQGDMSAQLRLGFAYGSGEGVLTDKREAARWFRKAAEQGEVSAQFFLGRAYNAGEGVATDKHEAVRWFRKAAEQGLVLAQFQLGVAYVTGVGAIADMREAYIWLAIAKAGGSKNAGEVLHEIVLHGHLPQSEIRSADKEAARRLEAINRRKDGTRGEN